MSVKLAVLKSGESIISNIKELISEEKVVGYDNSIYLTEDVNPDSPTQFQVTLTPWILFTEDTQIPVRPDWIVTVVNPAPKLKELYEERNDGPETNSINEQSDSFIAD
jgi:hypothetical protein